MAAGPSLLLQFFRSHFCDLQNVAVLAHDVGIVVSLVGNHAVAAVLDPVLGVLEVTAAFILQRVQRTVTEQTVEVVRILGLVTGEKFAVFVIDEGEVLSFPVFSHSSTSLCCVCSVCATVSVLFLKNAVRGLRMIEWTMPWRPEVERGSYRCLRGSLSFDGVLPETRIFPRLSVVSDPCADPAVPTGLSVWALSV